MSATRSSVPPAAALCTKHERVREALRAQIRDGTYPPGARLPSEQELPRLMNVSKITVVRALNDLEREGLIVRRHGKGSFVADPAQHPLSPSRFLRLGVLLPVYASPGFPVCLPQYAMLQSALQTWGMDGIEPVFAKSRADQVTRARWTSEARACRVDVLGEEMVAHPHHPPLEAVRAARLDGILSLSIIEEEWLAALLDLGVPTVLVDYVHPRFADRADQVFFDPLPGYRATVHALVAGGLRRIHFVGCWLHVPYARRADTRTDKDHYSPAKARPDPDTYLRKAAWRLAMDEAGLPCPPEWDHITWHSGNHVRALAEKLAALPEGQRPEAVVCHGIGQAETFVDVFRERGLPLQAAGATSGNHRHIAWPIFADLPRLGRTAAELLLRRIQQPTSCLQLGVPLALPDFVAAPVAAGRGPADGASWRAAAAST